MNKVGWKEQALRKPRSCCNSPGDGGLGEGRGSRDQEEKGHEGHVLEKRQAASARPSALVPFTLCHPYTCHPGKETAFPCLQKRAWTVNWAAKVAVTFESIPTQLSEKQSLPSAALPAPLYIKTALYVTTLLKSRFGCCVRRCCAETGSARAASLARRGLPGVPTCQSWWQWLLGCLSLAGFETRTHNRTACLSFYSRLQDK